MQGLSTTRIVDVDVSFAPVAQPLANFDSLLILGDTDALPPSGITQFTTISEVAYWLGTNSPEYQAAALFFSQTPQPDTLYIGRWARTPTAGVMTCGPLTAVEQLASAWNTITNGQFRITIDGVGFNDVSNLNFSGITNMNAVASIIDGALTGASCKWDGFEFYFKSDTSGPTSSVGYAINVPAGIGTQIAAKLRATAALAQGVVPGIAAETPVACVSRVDGLGWYGVTFASSVMPDDGETLAVAGYIQAGVHMYGVTSAQATILNAASTADIASQLSLADYTRTVGQYSLSSPYAICSFLGRAYTINFEGENTTITMMFKQEPGITPEILTEQQARTVAQKRFNVYAQYSNGVPITQEGMMCGFAFFDEIHGTDWLANRIQNDMYNVLLRLPKVPQTDAGIHILRTTMENGLQQAVLNGLIAPGTWNAEGFGNLLYGEYLNKGFYTYAPPIDAQSQAQREQRRAPLFQAAVKLAGAVHFADVLLNVNR